MMRQPLTTIKYWYLVLILCGVVRQSIASEGIVNVGVIIACPSSNTEEFILQVINEAEVLLESDYELQLLPSKTYDCGFDLSKVNANISKLLNDPEVDIILGMDVIASHFLASNGPYDKPVIATLVLNAQVQEIPINSKSESGTKNLTYVQLPYSPMRDIEVYRQMIGFSNLALVVDELIFEGIPEIKNFLNKGLEEMGANFDYVFIEENVDEVMSKLNGDYDAVYLFPSSILNPEQYQQLIAKINDKKLKSFSILGRVDVDRGVLAGVAPNSNFDLIARRVALNIQRIVTNEADPEDISVKVVQKEELVINMETARQIGFSPPWEVLTEGVLINEERSDMERKIGLFSAIAEGLEENLDIKITKRDVEISEQDVVIGKSAFMPELIGAYSHNIVDNTTANNSFGQNPQQRGLASISLNQVIYSEQVTANNRIQQLLLDASQASLEVQSLDVILSVSTSYLNLMQAKTAEKIQRENLEVTRKNLEIARLSSSLGQTGPSDLLRWQGEIATAKANLLNASAGRRQAEIQLNQVLNRPINEEFQTEEIDLNDARILINNEITDKYVSNPRNFYQYADFMTARAKATVPDLKQLDANIRVTERTLDLNRRNRYAPTVSLGGSYNYELYRGGSGTEAPMGLSINEDNWNLGLTASLPIFQGGNRTAQVQQSRVQLMQINTQRLNTERLIEQQVRAELENIRASYRNIYLTQDAADATYENFNIVRESYSQGTVTITQLLDAQNAAITARLNAANAIYVFLIDLLNMERATGQFYMLMTDQERENYSNELEAFFNE
jgi:outer membrane protein TolC